MTAKRRKARRGGEGRAAVTVLRRRVQNDPFGRGAVYDLKIEDEDGIVVIEDAAMTEETARKIAALFEAEGVSSLHARGIMEDLLADPGYVD